MALLLAAICGNLFFQYKHAIESESARLQAQSRVITDNLEAQLSSISAVLDGVRRWQQHRLASASASSSHSLDFNALMASTNGSMALSVLNEHGIVIASNRADRLGLDLSYRAYFSEPRAHPNPKTLYVSPPFETLDKVVGLNFTRVISDPQGRFAGVVTATLDPQHFRTLMRSVLYEPSMWDAIAHGNGHLFVKEPQQSAQARSLSAADAELAAQMLKLSPEQVTTFSSPYDGDTLLMSRRVLQPSTLNMSQPLVVAVVQKRFSALAEWRSMAAAHLSFFAAIALLCAFSLRRYHAQLKAAEAQRESASEQLSRVAERQEIASRASGIAVWDNDLLKGELIWDQAMFQLYGLTPQDGPIPDRVWRQAILEEDLPAVEAAIRKSLASREPLLQQFRIRRSDGSVRMIEAHGMPFYDSSGRAIRMVGSHKDVTEQLQTQSQLQLSANVFSQAHEGILITDAQQQIIDVNEAFTRITGYSRDEVLGRTPRLLRSGRQGPEFYAQMWSDLHQTGRWIGEIWNRRKDGMLYAELLALSSVANVAGEVQNYVALFSDITAIKRHQNDLERLAHFDALTGLPNRVLLADRLHQAMANAQRRQQRIAVAFLDLDGFKAINDSHGHGIGDELLIAVAQNMKTALREGDTLARLGGDEFVAVLLDLPDKRQSHDQSAEDVHPLISRLMQRAGQAIQIAGHELRITVSAGVSYYPQLEEVDGDQLLRQADLAMYQAKLAGKNRYSIFDAEHDRSLRSFNEGLSSVRQALQREEFVLHYQPKVNMRSGELMGVEALIRWQHPERGLLAPGQFLPEIENHSVIAEIGEWVIAAALAQLAAWQRKGLRTRVSVNIAGHHLQQDSFVARLRTLLAAEPEVQASQLELEVLESSALGDLASISKIVTGCRAMGVNFSIDDFGTGYSSLTYLKRLDAREIKVDQSFVREMLDDPENLAILEGVLGLARAFRRSLIAEGVETVAHGETLLRLGCEFGQGYGIARPMPAELLPNWAAHWLPDQRWSSAGHLDQQGRALLYALVEHRAWIGEVLSALTGHASMPALDIHQCRCGQWLDAQTRRGDQPSESWDRFEHIHKETHELALALHEERLAGRQSEVLQRLPILHTRRDELLTMLSELPVLPGAPPD